MQISIKRNNQRYGPYTLEQVQTYLASGHLQATDLAWSEGGNGWVPLSQIPGVQAYIPQGAPPQPPMQGHPGAPYPHPQPPYQPAPVPASKSVSPGLIVAAVGLAFILFIGFISLIVASEPEESSQGTTSAEVFEAEDEGEAISVSAPQLFAEYENNQVAADSKYKDNVVLVSGTVQAINKDFSDMPYIALESGNTFLTVNCKFSDADSAQLAQIQKGQQVTVRGTCEGKGLEVTIVDCSLE